MYMILSFCMYYYLEADDDETTLLGSMGKVTTYMTGGFDFDDKENMGQTFV